MIDTKRVLVVDDELSARSALGELLAEAGYLVDTAADGVAALGCFEAFAPDVVLTDLQMPNMGGDELMVRLRERNPDTPIVVMTAHEDRHTGVDVFHRGALGYLTKPVDFDELLLVLDGVLAPPENKVDAKEAE